MFDRGQPSGTSNLDGAFAIIAEDTLLDPAPAKAVSFLLNTAPFLGVHAYVRLGALGGAIYDTGDIIAIEASVNGNAFNTIAAFRSTAGASSPMALDTDNNGTGDGTQLSATLQDFSFPMPNATTLGLRVRCQSNTAGERLIVDRIVVAATRPIATDITAPGGTATVRFVGVPGLQYDLQRATTVSGPYSTIMAAGTQTAASDGKFSFTNSSGTGRFFFRCVQH